MDRRRTPPTLPPERIGRLAQDSFQSRRRRDRRGTPRFYREIYYLGLQKRANIALRPKNRVQRKRRRQFER